MAIDKIDGQNIYADVPIDSRFTFSTITTRNALNSAYRYEGMITYVIDSDGAGNGAMYVLLDGITNSEWTVVSSGSTGIIDTNRATSIIPDGTNLGDTDMPLADFMDACFYYDPPVINSFTGGTNLEKGETSLTKTLSFNITEPSGSHTVVSIVITGTDASNSGNIVGGGLISTHDVTLNTDTNTTYTITVTSSQTGINVTDVEAFAFLNRVFWDNSTSGTYNEAFIKALSNNAFDANYVHSFTVTAGASEYIYYAVPKDYTSNPYLNPPYFYVGGFAGGFEIAQNDISYTYGGNTEDYILYKSVNPNLGLTSISVQTT